MKRHITCSVEKAGFEPRTLGTKAERYDQCATRPVDLTWIHTAAQRTVMMKKVGSRSSGTHTGALLVHLKTALTRIPRTQTA
jgi:hypothetical protein